MKKLILPFLMLANKTCFCQNNSANFDHELAHPFNSNHIVEGWGPKPNRLPLSSNLAPCMKDVNWQRKRVLAAADYWIQQKLNYCHHYLPNYITPPQQRERLANQGGYCNQVQNIMPNSIFYGQKVRWNYTNKGKETEENWLNYTMWQGLDCSNYTAFIYNFAFGNQFSSNVTWQSGQRKDGSQKNLSPNQQSGTNILDNPQAAGRLVCADNTLEQENSCMGHGGYLSTIDSKGLKHKGSINASDLASLPLYPGDLLFISATRKNALNPSLVTHVVIWTGKQVGYGPNDIAPFQIAPNSLCPPEKWMPHLGDWVIADSHYQGPDYRILSSCFYLNNLWGVRRVIF